MINCNRYRAAFNEAPITPVFPPGIAQDPQKPTFLGVSVASAMCQKQTLTRPD